MGELTRIGQGEGATNAYLARAHTTPAPPVLLLHPWWGLDRAVRETADRLASDGFMAMAPDLYDGTVLTTPAEAQAFLSSIANGTAHGGALTRQRIARSAETALDELLARSDVSGGRAGVVGLSMGAAYGHALAGARREVAAFVAFYSGIFEAPPGVAYLGHFAEHDDFDDSAAVSELAPTLTDGSAAYVYPGTKHWFIESGRPEFDAAAAELAYARTVAFLRERLGP